MVASFPSRFSFQMLTTKSIRGGTVESRLRQLVMKLEYVDSLILAHPFIKGFDQISYCLSEDEVRAVAQGEISDAVANRKKEDIEGKEGAGPVYSSTFYIGLAIEPKPGNCSIFF
jgi:poly(A) polymerase